MPPAAHIASPITDPSAASPDRAGAFRHALDPSEAWRFADELGVLLDAECNLRGLDP